MTKRPTCIVVGSSFLDYVGYCDRVPAAGETVHSSSFQKGFGGKGANQAVMVAMLNHKEKGGSGVADVRMVTAVGNDGDGAAYIANLNSFGIDTSCVQQVAGQSTGLAMIAVSTVTGQNQIVICPNATNSFTKDGVDWDKVFGCGRGDTETRAGDILVVQNEIPLETTLAALEEAKARGVFTVFNPAPAPATPEEVEAIKPYMKFVDVFCPNEKEAALLAGKGAVTRANAAETCEALVKLGAKRVVITMGGDGYSFYTAAPSSSAANNNSGHHGGTVRHSCAHEGAKIVDTTGAGDCFVGTMVSYLLENGTTEAAALEGALAVANSASYLSVQKKGTQSSYPTLAEINAFRNDPVASRLKEEISSQDVTF